MVFTLDIGNTNIKTALFRGNELVKYWRLSTNKSSTSDEYGIQLVSLFQNAGLDMKDVSGIILSSVVPTINFTIEHMCRDYFKRDPMSVAPGIKTGINILYDNPRELGSDRICNAVAAFATYGGPCIFIDFGTATSFGAVNEQGCFIGGCICPGIKLASEALVSGAAKLPRFELVKPDTVINRTTITNLQAGLIYGYVGQVNHIVQKMKQEMRTPNAPVVATGGLGRMIADESDAINHIDGLLTLKGLRLIYERNQK